MLHLTLKDCDLCSLTLQELKKYPDSLLSNAAACGSSTTGLRGSSIPAAGSKRSHAEISGEGAQNSTDGSVSITVKLEVIPGKPFEKWPDAKDVVASLYRDDCFPPAWLEQQLTKCSDTDKHASCKFYTKAGPGCCGLTRMATFLVAARPCVDIPLTVRVVDLHAAHVTLANKLDNKNPSNSAGVHSCNVSGLSGDSIVRPRSFGLVLGSTKVLQLPLPAVHGSDTAAEGDTSASQSGVVRPSTTHAMAATDASNKSAEVDPTVLISGNRARASCIAALVAGPTHPIHGKLIADALQHMISTNSVPVKVESCIVGIWPSEPTTSSPTDTAELWVLRW